MPKVIVTPNGSYNPTGVRLLLSELGVGVMLQDETTIRCVMTDAQIARFRNSRGAAHKLEIVEDAPPQVFIGTPEDGKEWELDHVFQDAAAADVYPQTWGKAGDPRIIAHNAMDVAAAKAAGYKRVSPDPLLEIHSDDEPVPQDPTQNEQSTTPILDIATGKKGKK